MDFRDLQDLVAKGETYTVEFKAGSINDRAIVRAVVCLANGDGGLLLIGVDDEGHICGTDPRHGNETSPERLRAVIANRTEPSVMVEVDVVQGEGVDVIVIKVPRAHSVVATNEGEYVRRAIDPRGAPACVPMRPHEVLSRAGSIGAQDYSTLPLRGVTIDDLEAAEIDRMRKLASAGGDETLSELSDRDLLTALGLIAHDGALRVGAVLLFGGSSLIERHIPTHEIALQVLEGTEIRVNRIERVPLLRAMETLNAGTAPYNPEVEVQVGLFRLGVPRFGEIALRELLANALVHRDYTQRGPVSVQIDDQALTVSNPGGFPSGINISNFLVAPPRPRNPLLADAFKRAGLVERTGRGVNRIFESQLTIGRPAPDYGRSTSTDVTARLRSGPADLELAGYISELERSGQGLSLSDLMALHEVRWERRINTARAADLFQVSHQEARATLNSLVERGLLEARGENKGRTYHLAAPVYKRLGEPGGYIRTRGFDSLQQEQMILTFVDRHGEITRTEAADLCQLDPNQAGRLLRRLRDEGKLKMIGERRTSRYVKPGQKRFEG